MYGPPRIIRSSKLTPEIIRKGIQRYEQSFRTAEDVDYEWVVEYAKNRLDSYQESIKDLETKADAMMRYLAGGSTLLGALFSSNVGKNHTDAAFTTRPQSRAKSPAIREAFEHANNCNQDAEILFTRASILMEFELRLLATTKAHYIRMALTQFVYAVFWLVFVASSVVLIDLHPSWTVSVAVAGLGLLPVAALIWFESWTQRMRLDAQYHDWFEQLAASSD